MLDDLDIRTALFVSLLVSFFFGIALTFYAYKHKRFCGIYTVAVGFILLGTGYILLALRNYIDDFLSILVANSMIYISIAVVLKGLLRFLDINVRGINQIAVVLILIFIGMLYFHTYVHPSVNARIIEGSAFCALFSLIAVYAFFRVRKAYDRLLMTFLIGVFSAFALLHGIRAVWTVTEAPLFDFMNAGTLSTMTVIASQIIASYTSLLIIWIASDTLENELATMVRTDPLTSTHNRRALEEYFNMEIARAIRKGRHFSVVVCDIDRFKSVNDKFGHQFGDEVLVQFATLLKQNVRQMDFVARYGGEEFVILLPETTRQQAAHIADKLRRRVMEHGMMAPDGTSLHITASFGVAESGLDGTDSDALLGAADTAMYEAKRQGRNRVVLAGAEP
ncbi:GGDEF domain-containing protein [uncultured Rhodospira sp.]|uniref:GGDEF domain-containing protein n=1 Tax=uncultured Rhodospira sp. TaxID=1936189 RepID=UPI002605A893|nr:diguanylate cyclase [uncultured Rhodospira sp.]